MSKLNQRERINVFMLQLKMSVFFPFPLCTYHLRFTEECPAVQLVQYRPVSLAFSTLEMQMSYEFWLEPRFNEPLYSEVVGITNDFLLPGQNQSKMYGTEPRFNDIVVITNTIQKRNHKIQLDITNKCRHVIKGAGKPNRPTRTTFLCTVVLSSFVFLFLSCQCRSYIQLGSSLLLRRFVFRMAEASAKRVTGDTPHVVSFPPSFARTQRETSGYEAGSVVRQEQMLLQ